MVLSGLQIKSISITWALARKADSWALPRPTESDTVRVGPGSLCSNAPSRRFWGWLKLDNHSRASHSLLPLCLYPTHPPTWNALQPCLKLQALPFSPHSSLLKDSVLDWSLELICSSLSQVCEVFPGSVAHIRVPRETISHCSILNFLNPSIVSGSIQPTEDLFLYVPPQPSSIPTYWMSNKDLLNGEMND